MLKWKWFIVLVFLIYYLDIFACRRSPYHMYRTNTTFPTCNDSSDCNFWSRCYYGHCYTWLGTAMCWKHWQCRGFRRCVDFTCQDAPVPKNYSVREMYNQSSCDCLEDQVCKAYKCWNTCNVTFECPIGQSCNFMGFCYP